MTDLGWELLTEEEREELMLIREIRVLEQDIEMVKSLCERQHNSPLLQTRIGLLKKLEEDYHELLRRHHAGRD